MKAIMFTIMSVCYTVLSFGQGTSLTLDAKPTYEFNTENQVASVVKTKFVQKESKIAYREYTEMDCAKYRHIKTAGIVLTAIGGGMFMTGATLIAVDKQQRPYKGDSYLNRPYTPLRGVGGTMMGIGGLSLGAGIPLLIVGCVKTKRYCGGRDIQNSRSSLELHTGENGTGLALKF